MMKRITIAILSLTLVVAFCVPVGAADVAPTKGDITFGGDAEYSLSNNVYLQYDVATDSLSYWVGTVHYSGNRTYATTDATSVIWYKTTTKATTNPDDAPATGATSGQFDSTWSAM